MGRARTQTLVEDRDGSTIRRTVLPGGVRVVTEWVPGVRSAAMGVWVGAGSRDESPVTTGSAHFLEHLLFKGTRRRTALQISAEIEAVGGDLNAFTSKEYTCYHARVLDQDLDLAMDVVFDVVSSAVLAPPDVESERGVILEEIAMHEDDPGEMVHDEFALALFGNEPLGRPILGSVESINGLSRDAIRRFYRTHYQPHRLVVSAAGNVDHSRVVSAVRRSFGHLVTEDREPHRRRPGRAKTVISGGSRIVTRPTEQAHLVLGAPGFPRSDDRRYATSILATALGGGMSSRLFQEVREKRGLAYSVYSYAQGFSDTGVFSVYAGCLPAKADTVLEVCRTELESVARSGLSAEEIRRAQGQVRGAAVLGQEDTGARMHRIGKAELVGEEIISIGEVVRRVERVSATEVADVAALLLGQPMTLAVVGPFDDSHRFTAVA
ncbi:MAG: insulinase family protein [Actinobacteria bacterium]|nr:insulinase family protein [Actinomycetota bacterium]